MKEDGGQGGACRNLCLAPGLAVVVGKKDMTPLPNGHDPILREERGLIGTVDNLCVIDKVLHPNSFPPRSRYHDRSFDDYTYPGDTDT
ncbi:MAG: hypothetical protein IH897_12595, partial [Planctomycetes bacterium]|nr:hypothetical protein [Planctomycetota bacterium]